MSKKKATDYQLRYIHKNRPYVAIDFIDKKGRTMMSSVDVLLNSLYLTDGEGDWDYAALGRFVRTR
jgi:hypothetical protein